MTQKSIGNLLIRADANSQIGSGHVMRCLALAQAWQDAGGRAIFLVAESTAAIRRRLAAERCEVVSIGVPVGSAEDAHQSAEFAQRYEADWVVIDGYRFDSAFHRQIRLAGHRLLCVDDEGACEEYVADIVLNQNLNARASWYGTREKDRLLIGPRFCLLRREFARWRESERSISSDARKILITLGGSTPVDLGVRVIESLELMALEDLIAVFVVGGSTRNAAPLQQCARRSKAKISFASDAPDMAILMSEADVAISAAGSTCWELCMLGLPSVLIDLAPNQTPIAREMHRLGCALHVGSAETVTAEEIARAVNTLLNSREMRNGFSKKMRDLVDGRGAERVLAAMMRFMRNGVGAAASGVSA
jgi:UDP-2,4-diacetamido-2,4,6-trideoxy-beta-L-altropyranose hydrolase